MFRITAIILSIAAVLSAEPIESMVNKKLEMKLYEPDRLMKQLKKIEREFPNLSLSTDTALLKELYALDGSKRSGKIVNVLGEKITESRGFRRGYSYFPAELIRDPNNQEVPNSDRNFRNWGKVSLVGGVTAGTGMVLLLTAGVIALTDVLGRGDVVPEDDNSEQSQTVNKPNSSSERKLSRLDFASGLASVGGVCMGVGGAALYVYLPVVIVKVQQNKHWREDKISYHNRRRVSLAIEK